jgi:hypothetical protein
MILGKDREKHPPQPRPRKRGSGAEPEAVATALASAAAKRRKASAPRNWRAAAKADELQQTACTCLRCADNGWHAPFGAPLPSLLPGANLKELCSCRGGWQNSGAERVAGMILYVVIARSQRVRPEVAGPMTSSATKQSMARAAQLDCFASLAMTRARQTPREDFVCPPPRSETERGRGTMRSMVEGAR